MVLLLRMAGAREPASLGVRSCVAPASGLQVTVDEVDLLQTAQALTDVLRTDLTHALDRLQLGVGGGQHLVQSAQYTPQAPG